MSMAYSLPSTSSAFSSQGFKQRCQLRAPSGSHGALPARPHPFLPTTRPSHPAFPLREAHCCASASGQTSTSNPSTRPHQAARTKEDLVDPAGIGATGTSTTRLKDMGGNVSLTSYMTLPVEQYFVLDPDQIRHIGKNRFMLIVPRINLLNVWLEPEVEIVVTTTASPPRVVLQAENCRIRGSDIIENWKLDQRFCLRFVTELSWSSQPSAGVPTDGQITGNATLEVFSEVIPPFNLMPRPVLEGSCNVVMAGLVNTLLPLFLRKLGEDYTKWAAEPEYRQKRAERSMPLNSLDDSQL